MPQPQVKTKFGLAEYTVQHDGRLSLYWPSGVTIYGVWYRSASTSQAFRSRDQQRITSSSLQRDGGKGVSSAAKTALEDETERLTPLLVTPEAKVEARLRRVRSRVAQAEEAQRAAQEQLAVCQTEMAQAQLELKDVEQLHLALQRRAAV